MVVPNLSVVRRRVHPLIALSTPKSPIPRGRQSAQVPTSAPIPSAVKRRAQNLIALPFLKTPIHPRRARARIIRFALNRSVALQNRRYEQNMRKIISMGCIFVCCRLVRIQTRIALDGQASVIALAIWSPGCFPIVPVVARLQLAPRRR